MNIIQCFSRKTYKIAFLFGASIFIFGAFIIANAQGPQAKLYFTPASGSYEIGKTFSIRLAVESKTQAINLVQGDLNFSNNLEVTSISKDGSIVSFWFDEPKFSNSTDTVSFSGGIPNPGYTGTGRVLTINFRAKTAGSAYLRISSAQVLANDGEGTNILSSSGSANLTIYDSGLPKPVPEKNITPPAGLQLKISSTTHPDQQKWYNLKNLSLSWVWQQGITDFSYVLDKNSETTPDNTGEGLSTSVSYKDIKDDVWYFHIKSKLNGQWSKVFHYKVQVDTGLPVILSVEFLPQREYYQPDPTIKVTGQDQLSGIGSLEVKIDSGDFVKSSNVQEYKVPPQNSGSHIATIRLCDQALNCAEKIENFIINALPAPKIVRYTKAILFSSYPDTLVFEGTSIPQTEVTLFFNHETGKQFTATTHTGDSGDWTLVYKEMLPVGNYTAMAIASLNEQKSPPTNKVDFRVFRTGIQIGSWVVLPEAAVWSIILFLICLIAILVVIILFLNKRFIKLNKSVNNNLNNKIIFPK
ncbi:MAG: cohesin domain-containing protein [Patescibacteria group bacterium]|nr:cohesin domain-containing protein [Patescibacteria group bacterium]MDD5121524.1 cohesin domain-containing protein [Patescibacteria group bacterium]MDD5221854.1 cohesin domain-containing protein [Patescibacteria group bacterium]MDD5396313.1 cohesin domain-containing protein [Patescibacteria group bacterium]